MRKCCLDGKTSSYQIVRFIWLIEVTGKVTGKVSEPRLTLQKIMWATEGVLPLLAIVMHTYRYVRSTQLFLPR